MADDTLLLLHQVFDILSVVKLSSAPLQQLDNLGNKNMMKTL